MPATTTAAITMIAHIGKPPPPSLWVGSETAWMSRVPVKGIAQVRVLPSLASALCSRILPGRVRRRLTERDSASSSLMSFARSVALAWSKRALASTSGTKSIRTADPPIVRVPLVPSAWHDMQPVVLIWFSHSGWFFIGPAGNSFFAGIFSIEYQ